MLLLCSDDTHQSSLPTGSSGERGGSFGGGGARLNTLNDALLSNAEQQRYIGTDEGGQLKLASKARAILYEADLDPYDPYYDYHCMVIQFGFVTMEMSTLSIPLMSNNL